MDRDNSSSTPPALNRSTTHSPQLQPSTQPVPLLNRPPSSAPQLIQDLLTHDPVPSRPSLQPEAPNPPATPSNPQRHACEPCRVAKAKCEPLSGSGDSNAPPAAGPCKRCVKTDRECVFAERSKTRRRKRRDSSAGLGGATDQRVEELERRIENLMAVGLVNGITRVDGIARSRVNGSVEPKELDKGRVVEQRSRIQDVLNSPLERVDDLDSREPAAKRCRIASDLGALPPQQDPCNDGPTLESCPQYPPSSQKACSSPLSPPNSHQSPFQSGCPSYDPLRSAQDAPAVNRRNQNEFQDVIDKGFISLSLATLLYNHFTVELLPHTPFIVLPPFFTASTCRTTRPALFLAILVATLHRLPSSATEISEANGSALIDELHWMFAERISYKGEKSLDLVQALLVACSWYTTPADQGFLSIMEKHKGFMWLTQAISISYDLGLARPGASGLLRCMSHVNQSSKSNAQQYSIDETEGRRAVMGCYWLSVNICMILKRPHLMKWCPALNDCLETLVKVADGAGKGAAGSDKVLTEMIKAARIVEDSGMTGCFDNTQDLVGGASLKAARVKFMTTALEKQVEEWWNGVPDNVKYHNSISLTYYVLKIHIHEFCLHTSECPSANNHSSEPPRHGFADAVIRARLGAVPPWKLPPALTASYMPVIIQSAHSLLDTFLALGKSTIDVLPHVAFGRICYAILVLVKVERMLSAEKGPNDKLVEEIKLGYYLEKVLAAFGRELPKKGFCAAPKSCLGRLFKNMKNWWERQSKGCGGDIGECSKVIGSGLFGNSGAPVTPDPSSSASAYVSHEATPSSYATPSFTPVNPSTVSSFQNGQDHLSPPESVIGGTSLFPGTLEELSLGGWNLGDEDWIALMNAGGNGMQLFEF
ncbi:hypothetical protein BDZ91DRAFT_791512 [Kalaharituber pfeilii]|nr:hypothetical protein BDZ91DRAFT_791512 [Kalaharituber pfeilii]